MKLQSTTKSAVTLVHAGLSGSPGVSGAVRSYLGSAGPQLHSEPTGTAAAVHSPSLKPGLRRYEGGTGDTGFLKKGEQRVGGSGGWERERAREGEREGGERVQPRSTHLVRVGEDRIKENSSLKDLSPISVEIED